MYSLEHQGDQWTLVKDGCNRSFVSPFPTLCACFETWETLRPKARALEFVDVDGQNRNWTCSYRELFKLVRHASTRLQSLGIRQGFSVALAYENSPEVIILSLAAWSIGAKTVPLDLRRDSAEMMRYKLDLSDSVLLLTSKELSQSLEFQKITAKRRIAIIAWSVSNGKEKIQGHNAEFSRHTVPLSTQALVLFTSGTTAKPKGALLTQENLVANADGIADWLWINTDDRFLIVLPLHHINSTTMSFATFLRGGTVVLLSRYSNSRFWELLSLTKATVTSVVPTIIHDQLGQMGKFNKLKSKLKLTRIQLGSAPVVPQEASEFVEKTTIPLIQGYGQTETALRSTGVRWNPKHPRSKSYWKNLRSNTIGEEMKWTNVTVLAKNGKEAKARQEGEICVRGPIIMKEYLKNPSATKDAFRYGWFHSGDAGYWRLADGKVQFYLLGRLKEIIIKAGINISPLAIEQTIKRSIGGIDQAYVIGIPDPRLGEEIAVVIVWKNSPKEISTVVRGLSTFETPNYWFSVKANDLPMTSTGKVQRVKLKEMFSSCANIAKTITHIFRRVSPLETNLIDQARTVHNRRWAPMKLSVNQWQNLLKSRSLVIAVNRSTLQAEGSVLVENAATSIRCISISTDGLSFPLPSYHALPVVSPKDVLTYLKANKDPLVEFHREPKGGLSYGAKVVSIVKQARPNDAASLGYGVLMKYPDVTKPKKEVVITPGSTLGTQLIEAALLHARKQGIPNVEVLTRPVGLLTWALKKA